MYNLTESECLEAIYNGAPIGKIISSDIKDKFNEVADILELEKIPDNVVFTKKWLFPEEYEQLDLVSYFSNLVKTDEEAIRVAEELDLFIRADKEDLLKYLIYLSKVIKDNDIVIGVGRGSSVSLYTLYLIGIHKVHSIRYELDYKDFFKIKDDSQIEEGE